MRRTLTRIWWVLIAMIGFTIPAMAEPSLIEQNMALIPNGDPQPTQRVEILPAMRGVHPRLLLSADEFQQLRGAAVGDPVLGRHVEALTQSTVDPRRYSYIGGIKRSLNGPTPALVQAFYRLPNIVMAHGLNPTDQSRQIIIDMLTWLVDQPHWEAKGEIDSGMQAGAVMFLAGIMFDAVADDLDPRFRQRAAAKLFEQARRMYYLGHMERLTQGHKYWQQDPANNHRWHRNAGLVSCLLAVADEPGIESGWMMQQVRREMDFVMKWYPEDGDCHEGVTYSIFGFAHLATAALMMDRVIGTSYTDHSGMHNAWKMLVYAWSPQRKGYLSFGDANNRPDSDFGKTAAFFIGPTRSRDPAAQAALTALYENLADSGKTLWMLVPFYDPTLEPSSIERLPTGHLFEDLGVVYLRDHWKANPVVMMFKCGPFGGFKLNEYRHSFEKPHYINIAHDDPDANTFAMILGRGFAPHPSLYDAPKLTANHNTILVDGKGQLGSGEHWTQPIEGRDMRQLSYLVGWKRDQAGRVIVEGEAGNAYPTLKRFRRVMIWMPGQYVLILDNVVADSRRKLAWNAVSEMAQFTDPPTGRGYLETEQQRRLQYQMLSNRSIGGAIDWHMIRSPKGSQKVQRTTFSCNEQSVQFVCLLNPWNTADLAMRFVQSDSENPAGIVVDGAGLNDKWVWDPADDLKTPSKVQLTRDGKIVVQMIEADSAPDMSQ